ncbi:MAG: CbtB domain-containing protein [Gemmobacter sp.]
MTANLTTAAAGTQALSASALWPIAFVAVLGMALLFVAGHAQSATLHDSAHDMRHSTGFPCH